MLLYLKIHPFLILLLSHCGQKYSTGSIELLTSFYVFFGISNIYTLETTNRVVGNDPNAKNLKCCSMWVILFSPPPLNGEIHYTPLSEYDLRYKLYMKVWITSKITVSQKFLQIFKFKASKIKVAFTVFP